MHVCVCVCDSNYNMYRLHNRNWLQYKEWCFPYCKVRHIAFWLIFHVLSHTCYPLEQMKSMHVRFKKQLSLYYLLIYIDFPQSSSRNIMRGILHNGFIESSWLTSRNNFRGWTSLWKKCSTWNQAWHSRSLHATHTL